MQHVSIPPCVHSEINEKMRVACVHIYGPVIQGSFRRRMRACMHVMTDGDMPVVVTQSTTSCTVGAVSN